MRNRVKDKLVGIYAPGNYDHTSVLDQTQEFARWFWANHEDVGYQRKETQPHSNA